MIQRWARWTAILAGGASLGGCATLPAEEATFFQTLSKANVSAFDQQVKDEESARLALAARRLRNGDSRVDLLNCRELDKQECQITVDNAADASFKAPVSNSRAMLASIVQYADLMKQLADAADLDQIKAKAEAAAGAVSTVATVVSAGAGAVITPVVKFAALASHARRKEKRRNLMLEIANEAQPAIEQAAKLLQANSGLFRANGATYAGRHLVALRQQIDDDTVEAKTLRAAIAGTKAPRPDLRDRLELVEQRKGESLAAMLPLTDRVNAPRRLGGHSYLVLADAHSKIIEKLKNPKGSQEEAMKNLTEFLTILEAIKSDTAGG